MFSSKDKLLKDRLKTRFVVTLTDGQAFSGLLVEVDERSLALRDVKTYDRDAALQPVDGELIIPRDHISYIQKP